MFEGACSLFLLMRGMNLALVVSFGDIVVGEKKKKLVLAWLRCVCCMV